MAAGSRADSGFTRRQVLRASALTLGASALAACGSGGSAKQKTGKVHLTNVEHDDRPLDDAAYRAVYNAFRKKYPNITMSFQIIPWETSEQKMLTLGQGNGLPNVGRMAYPSDYAAADMVEPLEGLASAADKARYSAQALETYSAKGPDGKVHLYGMPWFAGAVSVMVNKTLVEKAGMKLGSDWTTDEFTNICKATTIKGKQWGVALDGNGIGDPAQICEMAIYSFGGRWVKGNPNSTTPEPIVIDSPETVDGLQWYIDLYKKGYAVPSAPSDTYQQRDANFLSFKSAIAWQGPWNIKPTQQSFAKGGYELVSMPLPKGPAGRISIYGGGASGIYKSSKQQGVMDQAWDWVSFISSDEGQKLYCQTNGMLPASNKLQKDPYWTKNPLYAGYLKTLENTPNMYPVWATGITTLVENNYLVPLLQGALNGNITAKQMATQLQAKVIAGLQKNGVNVPKS
jgi:multiple sugar transport system substrate-binding protein